MKRKKLTLPLSISLIMLLGFTCLDSCKKPEKKEDAPAAMAIEFNRPPAIGDNFTVHKFNLSHLDPGAAGESVNWDFSSLPESAETMDIVVESVDQSPNKSKFPDADFMIRNNYYGSRNLSDNDGNYHFFSLKNGKLTKLGRTDLFSPGNTLVNVFDNPEVQHQYPIVLNSSSTDDFSGSFKSSNIPFTWKKGKNSYTADATGTLTLKEKTVENVIRIKRERTYVSNSSFTGTNTYVFVYYEWYIKDIPFPILSLNKISLNNSQTIYEGYRMDASEF